MNTRIIAAAFIIAAVSFFIPSANAELRDLLAEAPRDSLLIIACADVPAFRAQLREVGADELVMTILRMSDEQLPALYGGLNGRLLIAQIAPGDDFLLIADISPDSEIAGIIARGNRFAGFKIERRNDGIICLANDDDIIILFINYRDGVLRLSGNIELVKAVPDADIPKITENQEFAWLLDRFELDRGLMFFMPDVQRMLFQDETMAVEQPGFYRNHEIHRMIRSFIEAFFGADRWRASSIRLEFADGVRIQMIHSADFEPPPGANARLTEPAWQLRPPFTMTGRSDLIKELIPSLRRAYAALDQDALDEFNEELAEANLELGFDFERDFLGNLTGEWSISVWNPTRWAFRFQVIDPELFLNQSRNMAALGGEEWVADLTAPPGAMAVRTRIYNVPLRLFVEGNAITLTSDAQIPQAAQGEVEPPAPAAGEAEILRMNYAIMGNPMIRRMLEQGADDEFLRALRTLPRGGRLALSISDGEGYRRIDINTEGLTPPHLRVLFEAIGKNIE